MGFEQSREIKESNEERLENIQAEKEYWKKMKEYLETIPREETSEQEEVSEGGDDENPDPPEKVKVKRLEFRGKTR